MVGEAPDGTTADGADHTGTDGGALVDLDDLVARWAEESALEESLLASLGAPPLEWISLAEAEDAANVSRSTLRAWYRSGRIPSRLMPGPHGVQRLVPRDAVVAQAARSPRAGVRRSDQPPDARAIRTDLPSPTTDLARLAELAVAEARQRAEAAETRAVAAEAALRAALERAATAEAELRLLGDKNRSQSG